MDLMNDAGPPGASTNGFNENLSLFQQGKCGMWIDATVAASFVTNPNDSTVADRSDSRWRPTTGWASAATGSGPGRWHPGRHPEGHGRGQEVHRVGDLARSTRAGRIEGRLGQRAAGHPDLALREPGLPEGGAVREDDARPHQRRRPDASRPSTPCPTPVSSSSRFRSSRASRRLVGQEFSAALAGQQTAAEALEKAQALTVDEMEAAGY